ncbi:cation diffusion facilitator CzcD-associated flavoprotein CzcO [Rhodococcus sp. AG1013]|uniref:flavin-containing monooxygenase n=1 Tax=Rhodococcus sp. AG1013 TaxID=2183996 RepID=UPI000E0A5581|nr:NAD(P)/FAD-dependent oxidoreductase [Rhodococcus sp. AG1013]RDI12365.1 cation diffusion facilitator CzcD-associated flavoprotein CzcO [Rhodococcus sp. AG1013]
MSPDRPTGSDPNRGTDPEHVDVLIVGAGLSGIGVASRLHRTHPGRSFAILEARAVSGGTWDLFRYPGIRSDSDVQTYGYDFKPWKGRKALAPAADILRYIRDTAREYDVERHIRYNHKVIRADWSSADARWTVTARRGDTDETVTVTADWFFCAGGYYNYDRGYTPVFPGADRFTGWIVHPQAWPEDLDYTGKRVVVIGSGATAVTLIPAMADATAHVTMLQRSPSYVIPLPAEDALSGVFRRVLGDERGYRLTRKKNIMQNVWIYKLSRRFPKQVRAIIRWLNTRLLPSGFDVDTHFNPTYDPWDQRLCVVPGGDLFKTISRGKASVVTDTIDTFTENGIALTSGKHLDADIIITATGLDLLALGGVELRLDGEPVDITKRLAFKGTMLSDIPNFSFAVGYVNAPWTLKVDLVADYLCRVLSAMDRRGADVVVAENREQGMETRPLLDFASGYIQRSLDLWPQAGTKDPWNLPMDYYKDVVALRDTPIDDGTLTFSRVEPTPTRSDDDLVSPD